MQKGDAFRVGGPARVALPCQTAAIPSPSLASSVSFGVFSLPAATYRSRRTLLWPVTSLIKHFAACNLVPLFCVLLLLSLSCQVSQQRQHDNDSNETNVCKAQWRGREKGGLPKEGYQMLKVDL